MLIDLTQQPSEPATRQQVAHIVSLLDVLEFCARYSSECAAAYETATAFVQAAEYGRATVNRYADLMTVIGDCVLTGKLYISGKQEAA